MTRASGWVGLGLGLIALVSGVQEAVAGGGAAPILAGVLAGVVLLTTAALTLRGRTWAQIVMSAIGLVLLARHVPPYFQTYRPWPALAIILLGSFTFGLGVLGLLMDRYQPPGSGAAGPPGRTA